jgi:hypothetical protein
LGHIPWFGSFAAAAISIDSKDRLFWEERLGCSEDVGLAEVAGDETPAALGDGGTSRGGGRSSPLRIPEGQSPRGDGGGAAVNPNIKNCEQVLRYR